MKQLILNIKDDSKLDIVINFLKEINFIEIEREQTDCAVKKWDEIPDLMLNPIYADNFKMYSREDLYDR
jgi:hypothetical protein